MDYYCKGVLLVLYLCMLKIKHGFPGQRRVNLPFSLTEKTLQNPVTSGIVISAMGFFPNAQGHYIDRPYGCSDHLLIYCVNGKGFFSVDGETTHVSEQQFFVLPANVPHSYGSDNDDPWTIYYAHFKGPASSYVAKRLSGLHTLEYSDTSKIQHRIDIFCSLLNVLEASLDEDALLFANMTFYSLLASLMEVKWFQESKYNKIQGESFISMACHLMGEQISGKLDMKGLSSYFSCSPSSFYRKFHAATGYSPYDYFIRMKMMKARELLEQTSLKVSQIAHMVGYDDVYFFSRYFRKSFGLSPRDYRTSLPLTGDTLSR